MKSNHGGCLNSVVVRVYCINSVIVRGYYTMLCGYRTVLQYPYLFRVLNIWGDHTFIICCTFHILVYTYVPLRRSISLHILSVTISFVRSRTSSSFNYFLITFYDKHSIYNFSCQYILVKTVSRTQIL